MLIFQIVGFHLPLNSLVKYSNNEIEQYGFIIGLFIKENDEFTIFAEIRVCELEGEFELVAKSSIQEIQVNCILEIIIPQSDSNCVFPFMVKQRVK